MLAAAHNLVLVFNSLESWTISQEKRGETRQTGSLFSCLSSNSKAEGVKDYQEADAPNVPNSVFLSILAEFFFFYCFISACKLSLWQL